MAANAPAGRGEDTVALVTGLLEDLRQADATLAVAESLTGGLLAAAIVDVPGASDVFRGGLVVYATDLKASLAGVDRDLLAMRGPVDPDVAVALAAGAVERCRADWGLATTGVAGPSPQGGIPAGTVYVAVAGPDNIHDVRRLMLDGDRQAIRQQAVRQALVLLSEVMARSATSGPGARRPRGGQRIRR